MATARAKGAGAGKKAQATPPAGYSALYVLPGGNYDVTKKYVESTDKQGHYRQVTNIKIPPAIEGMILRAIDDDPGYNRSLQGFIRDAIIHRLWYIAHNQTSTIDPTHLELEVLRQLMMAEQEKDRQIRADIDTFLDTIQLCVQQGAEDMAEVYVTRLTDLMVRPELSQGHRDLITEALQEADDMMSGTRKRRRSA